MSVNTRMKALQTDRRNAIPLYHQIEMSLRRKILSGEILKGALLPSEMALAEEYQVSRITVRQALANLDKDGLVARKRGKGNFVAKDGIEIQAPKFTGSLQDLVPAGIKTKVKLLDFSFTVVMPTGYLR
jgi:GntR family transcriptional regulator